MDKEKIKKKLLLKTFIDEESGCWLFGGHTIKGYGRMGIDGDEHYTHRISAYLYLEYDLYNHKLDVLHKVECKNKSCWNPEHLYIGTHADNMKDLAKAKTPYMGRHNRNIKYCKVGHEFTSENTYKLPNGGRRCRKCQNRRDKEFRLRRKLAS